MLAVPSVSRAGTGCAAPPEASAPGPVEYTRSGDPGGALPFPHAELVEESPREALGGTAAAPPPRAMMPVSAIGQLRLARPLSLSKNLSRCGVAPAP